MNAESVKARLKNFAVSSGCTFQDALVYYGLERTIYRLSVSPYASHFVLKGGIFLYAIFDRKYERATTDVDLLARRISNSAEEMKDVFRNIFAQDTDDALVFDLASITAEDITDNALLICLPIVLTSQSNKSAICCLLSQTFPLLTGTESFIS